MGIVTDPGIFRGTNGFLRLFTIIFGAIDLGILAHSYYSSVTEESFFLTSVIVLLIVSIILAVVAFLGVHNAAILVRRVDSLYHVIGGLILLVAAVLMAISVIHFGNHHYTSNYIERIIATVIGFINSLIYITVGAHSSRTDGMGGQTTCC